MRMLGLAGVTLGVSLVLISGCTPRAGLPKVSSQPLSQQLTQQSRAALEKCESKVSSLRSISRVSLHHGEERAAFRYATIFEKPGKLRIEAMPTAAAYTLSLLSVVDGTLTYLDPAERTAVRGAATSSMLAKFIGVPLDPADLMALFIGCMPHRLIDDSLGFFESSQQGLATVTNERVYAEVEVESGLLKRFVLAETTSGLEAFEVTLDDYESVEDVPIPGILTLHVPKHDLTMQLTQVSALVNSEVRPELFQTEIPADYSVREQ